jgi:hypothetical protein
MDLHLNDKSGLVTGSTAGIGLEIAQRDEGDGKFCAARPDAFRRHHRLSEKPLQ